jgi:hypothetical protein
LKIPGAYLFDGFGDKLMESSGAHSLRMMDLKSIMRTLKRKERFVCWH